MNRSERRRKERKQGKDLKKLKGAISTLSPSQTKLIDILAQERTDKLLDTFKELVTTSVVKSMRNNHISQERANKIIIESNEIMEKEIENGRKSY